VEQRERQREGERQTETDRYGDEEIERHLFAKKQDARKRKNTV